MGNFKESLTEVHRPKYQGPKSGEPFFESFESIRLPYAVITYMCFVLLNLLGRLQDFLRKVGVIKNSIAKDPLANKGFVPLFSDYESFYTRNLYRRVRDCWNRPISSSPGVTIDVMNRISNDHGWSFEFDGSTQKAINMGSYNYLGFGSTQVPWMKKCEESILKYGISTCSSRLEYGGLDLHSELEDLLAKFLNQEAAIITSMGFATNSLNMPCIFDKDTCVISDELNHNSLILGCRLSGATIKKFKHNDMKNLEKVLRETVVYGRPRTRRLYKKIFIVVEGIYSMEGSIVHLPELIELKKKYKAYIYLDEAHSIGALGPDGGGVIDYYGCNPRDVDVVMGTFTKSFGATGGYIAGSKRLINYIRANSLSAHYGIAMPPVITQQILSCLRVIMEKDVPGLARYHLEKLHWNTRYFRAKCHELGLVVFGNRDSPVVPVITYMPAKLIAFSRFCLARGLAVVVVGFPATEILLSRVRFCISASHNKKILDKTIEILKEAISDIRVDFSHLPIPDWCASAKFKVAPKHQEFHNETSSLDDLHNVKEIPCQLE